MQMLLINRLVEWLTIITVPSAEPATSEVLLSMALKRLKTH